MTYRIKVDNSDGLSGYVHMISGGSLIISKQLSTSYYNKDMCYSIINYLTDKYSSEGYSFNLEEVLETRYRNK